MERGNGRKEGTDNRVSRHFLDSRLLLHTLVTRSYSKLFLT